MIDLSWNPEYTQFIVAVLWSVVGFAAYYFLSLKGSFVKRIWKLYPNLDPEVRRIVLQRGWGVLFLGILSMMIILSFLGGNLQAYGAGFKFLAPPPWWSYIAIPLIFLTAYLNAPKPGNLALYPQMRILYWTPKILVVSGISWIAFLLGYEFLFRGFLLYASLEVMEPWAAIALNCTIYAFAHFYKGPGEAFGAIPLGVLLCYLTLYTGNIWSAVVIHSVMALSNEWFSIWRNPEIKVNGGW